MEERLAITHSILLHIFTRTSDGKAILCKKMDGLGPSSSKYMVLDAARVMLSDINNY